MNILVRNTSQFFLPPTCFFLLQLACYLDTCLEGVIYTQTPGLEHIFVVLAFIYLIAWVHPL
jgi:hypothetical protein